MKNHFCNFTPVLPTIYDDSLSYMEMIEKLAKQVDALSGNIVNIDGIIEKEVIKRTSVLNSLKNKKFIFFGDSYAVGYVPGGSETEGGITGFYDLAISRLGITNYTLIKYGRAGFSSKGTNDKTWLEDLMELPDDETVTDIYVCGGMNDVNISEPTVSVAISMFCTEAHKKYPNAIIHIGFVGRCSVNTDSFEIEKIRGCINVYKQSALDSGASYLSGIENVLKYPSSMASDNYHPNTVGETLLARYIINFITSNEPYFNTTKYYSSPWSNNSNIANLQAFGVFLHQDGCNLLFPQLSTIMFTNPVEVTMNMTAKTKLFDLVNLPIGGDKYETCGGNVSCTIITDTGLVFLASGYLYLIDNQVWIKLNAITKNTTETLRVSQLLLNPFSIEIPFVKTL